MRAPDSGSLGKDNRGVKTIRTRFEFMADDWFDDMVAIGGWAIFGYVLYFLWQRSVEEEDATGSLVFGVVAVICFLLSLYFLYDAVVSRLPSRRYSSGSSLHGWRKIAAAIYGRKQAKDGQQAALKLGGFKGKEHK